MKIYTLVISLFLALPISLLAQTGVPPVLFPDACYINNTSRTAWFDNEGHFGAARAVFEAKSHSSKFGTEFVQDSDSSVLYYQAPVLAEFRYNGELQETYFGGTKIGDGSCRGIDTPFVFLSTCETFVDLLKPFGLPVILSEVTKGEWKHRNQSGSKQEIYRTGYVETNGPNPYGFPGDRRIRIDYRGAAELLNFGNCPDDVWTLPLPKSVADYKRRHPAARRDQFPNRKVPHF